MVDKVNNPRDNSPMLLFQDDGGGMDPEGIRRCMSLGFSNKKSKTTIGQYGNGFKTSTMRLGADAIVFSRANRGSCETQSIGLLSYTFLRRTIKDDIFVPMVDFQILGGQQAPLTYGSQDDWDDSLRIILEWSPFSSKEKLMQQFEDLESHGTKVLIYNLWMNDEGLLELDFDDDDEDILLRNQSNTTVSSRSQSHKEMVQLHFSSTLRYSLRAYASILYLRKFSNFQIILRGKPVEQVRIADELKFTKSVTYKPQMGMGSEDVSVRITIGFAKEAPVLGIFGINVYHKNRLIMPFWKVVQEGSSRGRCVVGVLEANFIEPAHDKQDFERTPLFIRLETKLRHIILDYWKNNCHHIGYQEINSKQKGSDKHSNGLKQKAQQQPFAGQHVIDLSADVQPDVHVEKPVSLNEANAVHSVMEPTELSEDLEEHDSFDILAGTSIEKLSEENIQLFGRREELQRRETELKQTIEDLERELGEAKRKCTHLVTQLGIQKKQEQTAQRNVI
ncbi:protein MICRORCHIDIA 2-like [Asparagus officinalis]|uniref:protein MICRORCHIDIA 2-like n=1 Tax=Asparagus officinalis TaxID=4686 RepID=UPI00098E2852|nr:protein MICRORCHIDIA 2-like [Asparagus officinalis]